MKRIIPHFGRIQRVGAGPLGLVDLLHVNLQLNNAKARFSRRSRSGHMRAAKALGLIISPTLLPVPR
jgi:hypothetical protein